MPSSLVHVGGLFADVLHASQNAKSLRKKFKDKRLVLSISRTVLHRYLALREGIGVATVLLVEKGRTGEELQAPVPTTSMRPGLGKYMKIDALRKYAVFVQYMNYSRAAKELGISQPALSYQIAQMEKELRFSLVEHGTHPRLTSAGTQFAEVADKLTKSYDKAVAQCRAVARQQADTLIFERPVCSAAMHHEFNQLILRFNSIAIDTTVELFKTSKDTLANSLALGKVDAGFIYSRPEFVTEDFGDGLFGLTRLPLPDSTDVGFFMRGDQKLAKKPYIELDDLEGQTFVLPADARYRIFEHSLRQCIQDAGVHIHILHRGKDFRDAMRALENGELMFAGFDQADEEGFEANLGMVTRPYKGDEWCTSPYVVYRIDNNNPALERFLRYIEEAAL